MHDEQIQKDTGQSGGPQFREAFERLIQIAHGFLIEAIFAASKAQDPDLVDSFQLDHLSSFPRTSRRGDSTMSATIPPLATSGRCVEESGRRRDHVRTILSLERRGALCTRRRTCGAEGPIRG